MARDACLGEERRVVGRGANSVRPTEGGVVEVSGMGGAYYRGDAACGGTCP